MGASPSNDWLFSNPVGPPVAFVAVHANQLVGGDVRIPRRLHAGGRKYLAYHGGPFVDPAVRRKGVWDALFVAAMAELDRRGADFIFGYPNDTVIDYFANRWHAYLIGPHHEYVKVHPPRSLRERLVAGIRRRIETRIDVWLGSGGELVIDERRRWDASLDRPPPDAGQGRIELGRERDYLAWRFARGAPEPLRALCIARRHGVRLGWATLQIGQSSRGRVGRVLDLAAAPDARAPLLAGAEHWFRQRGCVATSVWIHDPAAESEMLTSGFKFEKTRSFGLIPVGGRTVDESLRNPAAWFLTGLDRFLA
jgi:hypothetical protein